MIKIVRVLQIAVSIIYIAVYWML